VAYFEVSARNGKNISKAFEHIAEQIYKQHADQDEVKVRGRGNRKRLEIDDDKDRKTQPNKSKCC
jgi:cell division protein FtsB